MFALATLTAAGAAGAVVLQSPASAVVDGVAVQRVRLEEGLVVALGTAKLQVRRRGVSRLRIYAGEDPHAFQDHRLGARTRIGTVWRAGSTMSETA